MDVGQRNQQCNFSHFETASNKRALICCTDDQRSHEFVRGVLRDCDREENHGNDTDDCDNDHFSVSDHNSVNAQGDDDRESKQTIIYA